MRFTIGFFLVFCLFIMACHKEDDKIEPGNGNGDRIDSVLTNRTVLVYMVGDNSLSRWTSANIKKMEESFRGEGNLIMYVDDYNDSPLLVRLVAKTDGTCVRDTIRKYEEGNSASPAVVSAVIAEVCGMYPADSYGLILWSHGTGWLPSDSRTRAFGQDGNNWMELTELTSALPDRCFDFILFDACYMGGVEVAYALRNKTNYLIASVAEIWEDGFPYDAIVGNLWKGEEDYRKVCQEYFDFYNSMSGIKRSGTISLVKTEGLEKLAEATRDIVAGKEELIMNLNRNDIQRIDRRGSLYWYNILYDFDDYIGHLSPTDRQYEVFKQRLAEVMVFEAHTETFGGEVVYRKCCGLSSYIPQSEHPGLNDFYAKQDWTRAVYQSE